MALRSIHNERRIVGRLRFSLEFQHYRTIEVSVKDMKFEFEGKREHDYSFSLQAQTSDVTIESDVKSPNLHAIYEPAVNRTFLQLTSNSDNLIKLPCLTFETTYVHISSSCLKICLWRPVDESLASPSPMRSVSGSGGIVSFSSIQLNVPTASTGIADLRSAIAAGNPSAPSTSPGVRELLQRAREDADVLLGESYIAFPKLLGEEMLIFDQKEALLIYKELVVVLGNFGSPMWSSTSFHCCRRTSDSPLSSSAPSTKHSGTAAKPWAKFPAISL
jgi:hypothetical protein